MKLNINIGFTITGLSIFQGFLNYHDKTHLYLVNREII